MSLARLSAALPSRDLSSRSHQTSRPPPAGRSPRDRLVLHYIRARGRYRRTRIHVIIIINNTIVVRFYGSGGSRGDKSTIGRAQYYCTINARVVRRGAARRRDDGTQHARTCATWRRLCREKTACFFGK